MSRYGAYRGRRTLSPKNIFIVILILLVVVAVGYFVLEPYLVYSDSGLKLDFSQSIQNTPDPTPTPTATPELVITTPEPTPSEEPAPILTTTSLLSLSTTALLDGTVTDSLQLADSEGAILLMKDIDGDTSALYSESVATALSDLSQSNLYLAAYLSCYRDNTTPYSYNTLALRTNSGNWWDYNSNRWLSPDTEAVSTYLADLCVQAAELGFDQLVLDYAAFPTSDMGDVDTLLQTGRYPIEDRTSQLEAFYQLLTETMSAYPEVTLSVVLSSDVLEDGGVQSGQTLTLVAQYFDYIWVDFPESDLPLYESYFLEAGIDDPETTLVFQSEGTLPLESTHIFMH